MNNDNKKFALIFFSLICLTSYSQKRGLAYGFHSYEDIDALGSEISWWYNWSEAPEETVSENYSAYNYEFVPMTWNSNFNEEKLRDFLSKHPETKYLLAFNEPNFLEQANMTPSQVAAIWPTIEKIANDYNLEIVGPAVNFCGNCVTENNTNYTSPFEYLDDFFEICENCKVDHIAVHVYMNTIEATSWFIGEFKNRYNKPIWVTEFAGWEDNDVITASDNQINYMISAVDYFESESSVFRYSWFIGRTNNGYDSYPYIDILENKGTLTPLGEAYKKMPTHSPYTITTIPALIEAENYTTMHGIFLEKTEDQTGFANVGYIDEGDWLTYKIKVLETESFPISFRIASNKSSSMKVLVDDIEQFTQNITDNGGEQNWSTFNNIIQLDKGEHILKLEANTNGFNINWLQIGDTSLSVVDNLNIANAFSIYPNPFNSNIFIESTNIETYTIKIHDITGKKILKTSFNNKTNIDLSALNSGMYIAVIEGKNKRATHKLIKEY